LKSGLNATVVVENKPGATTTLAAGQVAKAEPDGHTLMIATSTTLAINPALFKKLPYDPLGDFTPIALVAGVPFALIVNPALPVATLQEFVAYARARPGALTYGSPGNGSPHHLAVEMLKTMAGLDMKHVAYRGSVPAMNDVMGGHIPFMIVDLQPALPLIRDGKLRALGVTTKDRVTAAPDIPTFAEQGFTGYEVVAWQGIFAAGKIAPAITTRLAAEIDTLFRAPATRERLIAIALQPFTSTPETFASYVKTEIDRWAPIVKASGATAE
jgi:tripartite-type tricarboxylate transporter receptor subunit TctC